MFCAFASKKTNMKRIMLKKTILSAIMLFGAVVISASEEKKQWLSEGSLMERTENWGKRSSLTSAQEDETETPPGEPWGVPVGDGVWYILAATCIYALYKKRNQSIILQR
jgi:hypothetical protein